MKPDKVLKERHVELELSQCHEMDFFEGLNILVITFCVCADGFHSLPYTIINFLFGSLKMLTMFSCVNLSLAEGKCARINLSV